MRGTPNDTEVPDLAIDEGSQEVRFNWLAMFSQFIAEDKLHSHYVNHEKGSLVIFEYQRSLLICSSYMIVQWGIQRLRNLETRWAEAKHIYSRV